MATLIATTIIATRIRFNCSCNHSKTFSYCQNDSNAGSRGFQQGASWRRRGSHGRELSPLPELRPRSDDVDGKNRMRRHATVITAIGLSCQNTVQLARPRRFPIQMARRCQVVRDMCTLVEADTSARGEASVAAVVVLLWTGKRVERRHGHVHR